MQRPESVQSSTTDIELRLRHEGVAAAGGTLAALFKRGAALHGLLHGAQLALFGVHWNARLL